MATRARLNWNNKKTLEKTSIVVNFLVGLILLYYGLIKFKREGLLTNSSMLQTSMFQLLVGFAFILMGASELLEV